MVLSSRPRIIVGLTLLVGLGSAGRPIAQDPSAPWITTDERLTLLSANDGATHLHVRPLEYDRDPDVVTQDSITVVRLGPDHPPIVNTVYGTAPNSIIGAPYIAMTGDGRYGFVPSMRNPFAPALFGVSEPADLISVIDLGAVEPIVTQTVDVPLINNMLHMHPNGRHLLVPTTNGFQVYEMRGADLALVRDNPTGIATLSFDINAAGDRIIASGRSGSLPSAIDDVDQLGVHLFSYDDGAVEYLHEVDVQEGLPPFRAPFSMRFSPDGTRVLVPNGGGGGSKGSLDDILIGGHDVESASGDGGDPTGGGRHREPRLSPRRTHGGRCLPGRAPTAGSQQLQRSRSR